MRWFVENERWIERGKRVMTFEHELSKVKLSACGERRQAKIIPQGRRRGEAGTV